MRKREWIVQIYLHWRRKIKYLAMKMMQSFSTHSNDESSNWFSINYCKWNWRHFLIDLVWMIIIKIRSSRTELIERINFYLKWKFYDIGWKKKRELRMGKISFVMRLWMVSQRERGSYRQYSRLCTQILLFHLLKCLKSRDFNSFISKSFCWNKNHWKSLAMQIFFDFH